MRLVPTEATQAPAGVWLAVQHDGELLLLLVENRPCSLQEPLICMFAELRAMQRLPDVLPVLLVLQ